MVAICRGLAVIAVDVLRQVVHEGLEGILDDAVIVGIDMNAYVGDLTRLAAAETGECNGLDRHTGCRTHRRQDVCAVARSGDREQQIATLTDLDVHYGSRDGAACAEFSWAGSGDDTPASGRGWAALGPAGRLVGHIFIHNGDDSGFVASASDLE